MAINTKIKVFNFFPYECEAAEEYLNDMARKGWILKSIKGPFLTFKRDKSKTVRYTVDILHRVSEFDCKDSNEALEYRDYCEAAGWKFVGQRGKVQIFYTEEPKNTLEIHTDEKEKFRSVFKASLYNALAHVVLIGTWLFYIYTVLFASSPDYTLSHNFALLTLLMMMLLVLIFGVEVVGFITWSIRANRNLKVNKVMKYNNYKQIRIKRSLPLAIALITLISMICNTSDMPVVTTLMITFIPVIGILITRLFINKKRYSRNVNIAITLFGILISAVLVMSIVGRGISRAIINIDNNKSQNSVELSLTDFGYKEANNSNPYTSFNESILAKRSVYFSDDKEHDLSYTIFESKYPMIVEFNADRLVKTLNKYKLNIREYKSKLPSGVKVYALNESKSFILVYGNRMIDARNNFTDMDDEKFLSIVYDKVFKE
ncbi:hypothetical protein CSC2_50770 [Clostridium zeae]|uniref:DUF2812 domain-containing protein n=1 Tax=Clostridium zeae TaxID=2759022 RepID=A0ABQ1EIP8_9CLOT|nr:DUF2812 domain-containing protein [Clostridium zeae]GFZ34551.1 hypothetical protein CSC2_50770 [Clostridium zeae]